MNDPRKASRILMFVKNIHTPLKARRGGFILALFLLVLSGCADAPWPSWLTGEPDESILNAPRVVETPSKTGEREWPNLANVPQKPVDYSTEPKRRRLIKKLTAQKRKAEEIKKRADETPMPPTLSKPAAESVSLPVLPSENSQP